MSDAEDIVYMGEEKEKLSSLMSSNTDDLPVSRIEFEHFIAEFQSFRAHMQTEMARMTKMLEKLRDEHADLLYDLEDKDLLDSSRHKLR